MYIFKSSANLNQQIRLSYAGHLIWHVNPPIYIFGQRLHCIRGSKQNRQKGGGGERPSRCNRSLNCFSWGFRTRCSKEFYRVGVWIPCSASGITHALDRPATMKYDLNRCLTHFVSNNYGHYLSFINQFKHICS